MVKKAKMTSPIGRDRKTRGLTLIELLLSVVLFASVAVVVLPALGSASQMTQLAVRKGEAYLHGMTKMSELELQFTESETPPHIGSGRFRSKLGGPTPYSWEVFTEPYSEDPPLQKVTLIVAWPRGSQSDSIELQTLLRLRETEE